MIKKSTLVFQLLFVTCLVSYGQIPANYYSPAEGLTCQELKTTLKNIIVPKDTLTYTPGVWNAYQFTDIHRNDANNADIIWDMYSDNPTGPEAYTYTLGVNQCGNYSEEGDCYNREHTLPQSWFKSEYPMKSDLHDVIPTDGEVNGIKNDFPYGEVSNPTFTSTNGSKLGPNTFGDYTGTVFEPRNEYKGDLARVLLYIAIRYEDLINNWYGNANADVSLLSPADQPDAAKRKLQVYDTWYLKLLIKWHNQDPVSQKEIDRNNAIYYHEVTDSGDIIKVQGNRNPFIDHPEYVNLIWQCTGLLPVTIIDFKGNKAGNDVILNWIVNNEADFEKYEIEKSTDGILFKKTGEVAGQNLSKYFFTDENPKEKNIVYYRLKMIDIDGKYQYSKTIAVRLNDFVNATIFPNPATNNLILKLERLLTADTKLKITDAIGRIIKITTVKAGQSSITLDINSLSAGKYFVTLFNQTDLIRESFIVVK